MSHGVKTSAMSNNKNAVDQKAEHVIVGEDDPSDQQFDRAVST